MFSDTELIERIRQGDAGAFDALLARHYPMVWRIVRSFTTISADADDLAQETFVTAYRQLHTLEQVESFPAWLATIARNLGRMWRRQRATQQRLLPLDGEAMESDLAEVSTEATEEREHRDEIRQHVHEALASLSPSHRDACRLHYLWGYDYSETAILLDIPVAALRGRLHRARGELRKELHEMATPQHEVIGEFGECDLAALRVAAGIASTTTEPERQMLNSICITSDGYIVATDSYRLFCTKTRGLCLDHNLILHADIMRTLRDEYPTAVYARLSVTEQTAILSLGDGKEISGEIREGTFPTWQKVLAGSSEVTVTATARVGDWLEALGLLAKQRPAPETDPQSPESQRILMTLSPMEGRVSLRAGVEAATEAGVAMEWTASFPALFDDSSKQTTIGAQAPYVEDAIRALGLPDDGHLRFFGISPLTPFVFRPANSDDIFVLTAPMQYGPVKKEADGSSY